MISLAYAQTAAPATPGFEQFLPLVIIFVLFWLMLIRPQMKRAKEQKKMLSELAKGDEVVTGAGQVGKIVKIGEQYISLEIADGVVTHVQKQSIQTLLPKGTIKGL
ncbi:preprotein translocase subunit YajC [Thiobacillus sedimenti]|uniref:Sec translocon accessory complex subunit YajC n=1 Tax=Thiobacillus sedimenti TaxID=3110231 RepID=A0ABZ1CGV0_9PROT|nr:preprotein translocase subunit YajC [Thiobacillus sp. SCUT-2]WRS38596.1 preprotein translocase subunit YajC [Thiobacillus sp. SCUT-2]